MTLCTSCGNRICQMKAMYYKKPLSQLCNKCRAEEIKKLAEKNKSEPEAKSSSDPEK